MIVNFSVRNFGSIKDKQTLSFEATKSSELEDYYIIRAGGLRLLKMALIYGANASGKTTVLNALDFLRDLVLEPVDIKTQEFTFNRFLFDVQTPYQNTELTIEFIQNDVRYEYEVVFSQKSIVSEELHYYKPNRALVFKRTTNFEKQLAEINFGSKIKVDNASQKALETNTLWNNTVLGGFLKTNIELDELKEVTDWFSNYFSISIFPSLDIEKVITSEINTAQPNKNIIIEILKKADLNISDYFLKENDGNSALGFFESAVAEMKILVEKKSWHKAGKYINLKPATILEFEHTINGAKYILPFEFESNGTKRYYGLAGLLSLLILNSHVFPIDELESSLHPDLYMHFILTFLANAKRSQIIATTHNREILNNKELFRNDAIWFTEKGDDAATRLYSLADFDTKVIRDTTNVYNAYKSGKLGGVPRLGDYYINTSHEEDAAH